MIFGYFTLLVALIISAVAAYYSIVGLTAIFAAAVIPIIVMGAALEVGKITAAVWLKINWSQAGWTYKLYLVPAVAFLMLLTSMGIFGFLSKAHSDQSLVSGDVLAKIAIYDERIKTSKENIDANRRALKQLDEAVDQVMARSQDEKGADKAVAIRRGQARERTRLLQEIETEQKRIAKFNEERAPIAAEVRKVEAEVGPIKYVAALIYGDNPDSNLLERAVRWVIILIVIVFDPLALVLILAAQQSIRWAKEDPVKVNEQIVQVELPVEPIVKNSDIAHSYLDLGFGNVHPPGVDPVKPMVWVPEEPTVEKYVIKKPVTKKVSVKKPTVKKKISVKKTKKNKPKIKPLPVVDTEPEPVINIKAPVIPKIPFYTDLGNDYFDIEGKMVHSRVIRDLYPEVHADIERKKLRATLGIRADNDSSSGDQPKADFGTQFPNSPNKGDMFLHVGSLPTRLFKYNGNTWIQVDKSVADSYTYDEEYLKFLVDNISKGVISADDLTASEQDQVEQYLKKNA